MPIYEYYCENCDKTYEFFQRITDKPKETCEVCSGHLTKQISLSSFHLKGSGWYVTDYAKGNGQGNKSTEDNGNGEKKTSEKKDKKEKKTEKAGDKNKAKTESKPKSATT